MIKQTFFRTLDELNEWLGPNGNDLVQIISIYWSPTERVHFVYYRETFDEERLYNENLKMLNECTRAGYTAEAKLMLAKYGAYKPPVLRGNLSALKDLNFKLTQFLLKHGINI